MALDGQKRTRKSRSLSLRGGLPRAENASLSLAKSSLPVCQLNLPRLGNSTFRLMPRGKGSYITQEIEFASLPRFLKPGEPSVWSVFARSPPRKMDVPPDAVGRAEISDARQILQRIEQLVGSSLPHHGHQPIAFGVGRPAIDLPLLCLISEEARPGRPGGFGQKRTLLSSGRPVSVRSVLRERAALVPVGCEIHAGGGSQIRPGLRELRTASRDPGTRCLVARRLGEPLQAGDSRISRRGGGRQRGAQLCRWVATSRPFLAGIRLYSGKQGFGRTA